MKPFDVKSNTYIDSRKEFNSNDPNLKLAILLEYKNINLKFNSLQFNPLQFNSLQIGLKKFLWLKKLLILCRGHMLLMILMETKL